MLEPRRLWGGSRFPLTSLSLPSYFFSHTFPLPILPPVNLPSSPVDGLHSRSGIPSSRLSELHGSVYRERCSECEAKCLFLSLPSNHSLSRPPPLLTSGRPSFQKWHPIELSISAERSTFPSHSRRPVLCPVHLPSSSVDGLYSRSGISSSRLSDLHGSVYRERCQELDGLHSRSGIPPHRLSELHGSVYRERCRECGAKYLRPFDVTAARGSSYHRHKTGRLCTSMAGAGAGAAACASGGGVDAAKSAHAAVDVSARCNERERKEVEEEEEEDKQQRVPRVQNSVQNSVQNPVRKPRSSAKVRAQVSTGGGGSVKEESQEVLVVGEWGRQGHEPGAATSSDIEESPGVVPPASKLPRLATHLVIINLQRTPLALTPFSPSFSPPPSPYSHQVPPASKLPRLATHLVIINLQRTPLALTPFSPSFSPPPSPYSHQVPPASKLPRLATHLVIINLQRTPLALTPFSPSFSPPPSPYSHQVPPASKLPRLATHLVIINLQRTPLALTPFSPSFSPPPSPYSHQVPPASKLPRLATHLVIINLQRTPLDRHASITIRARIDAVLPRLLHLLHLPLPAYLPHSDPLLSLPSTRLHSLTHTIRLPLSCIPPPSPSPKRSTQAAEEKGKDETNTLPQKDNVPSASGGSTRPILFLHKATGTKGRRKKQRARTSFPRPNIKPPLSRLSRLSCASVAPLLRIFAPLSGLCLRLSCASVAPLFSSSVAYSPLRDPQRYHHGVDVRLSCGTPAARPCPHLRPLSSVLQILPVRRWAVSRMAPVRWIKTESATAIPHYQLHSHTALHPSPPLTASPCGACPSGATCKTVPATRNSSLQVERPPSPP
ncbi:unnamed protein product [Closterium sp. Naga37s-1]|nr:unnamed protein product [Closterium sp. Naga37s-1]